LRLQLPQADRAFLLSQRQVEAGYHKNIAYRPESDRVSGFVKQQPGDDETLRRVLRDYSRRTIQLTAELLPSYARAWRIDFASFRPQEEAGRRLSVRARNDLVHVDAFPTRPSRGRAPPPRLHNHHPDRPADLADRRPLRRAGRAVRPPLGPARSGPAGRPDGKRAAAAPPARAAGPEPVPVRRVHAELPPLP